MTRRAALERTASALYQPSGFFVVRTPLLPVEALLALLRPEAEHASASAELHELGARLSELLARPEVREALFLASPSFSDSLERWQREPASGAAAELSTALRYVTRMATRPTPFGLFAGYSLGVVAGETRLALRGRDAYRRRSRLDMEYIAAVASELEHAPEARHELHYRPNSSLYEAFGRVRYVEDRREGRRRSYHLVSVDPSPALSSTLTRAREGATARELAAALVSDEVSPDDADGFVAALIECRILISNLEPTLTGPDTLDALLGELEHVPALHAPRAALCRARDELRALDERPLGVEREEYRAIAGTLRELSAETELRQLFQIDLQKPVEHASLGPAVIAELARGIELLHRVSPPRRDPLQAFKQAFIARYEGREMPVSEALDDELGIGYGPELSPRTDDSALLAGLRFPGEPASGPVFSERDAVLLRLLEGVWSSGARVLELSDDDVKALGAGDAPPVPDAVAVMATIAGKPGSEEFSLYIHSVTGPSGVRLLGRFCAGDDALDAAARAHLRAEEALQPGAVFAELVCQPQDRVGNVLARPVLRDHEIPYLGRSGAPLAEQIPITDLYVRIANDRVVLRSRRLNREVVPRLSTAHYHSDTRNPTLYRFLAALQTQDVSSGLGFHFGACDGARFLPRVVAGKLVLARARWILNESDLKPLRDAQGAGRKRAAAELRARLGVPRWAVLIEDDHELVLDLEQLGCLDALLERPRSAVMIAEWFGGPDELVVIGPEGHFANELIVPFVRAPRASEPKPAPTRNRPEPPVRTRLFAPGSSWLYAKLYSGHASSDLLLEELVRPLARGALANGAAHGWFFIRYADPEPHLRVRLRGDPEHLWFSVLPRLRALADPFLRQGVLRRLELATYERELERYGGETGMDIAEALFCADSKAALEIASTYRGDSDQDARWRLALLGMHGWFDAFALELDARVALTTSLRDSFAKEFRADRALREQLRDKFRSERANIAALLGGQVKESGLGAGIAALDERGRALAPLMAELREADEAGRLCVAVADMLPSFVHLFVNRVMRSDPRAHELVLYELLSAHYRALSGRARAEQRRAPDS